MMRLWSYPSILQDLKPRLVCLVPEVRLSPISRHSAFILISYTSQIYPQIYNYATIGIRAFMDAIRQMAVNVQVDGMPTELAIQGIELMAQVERCYNYATTGNTKCFASAVMSKTWLSTSSITDGLPSFNTRFINVIFDNKGPKVWASLRGWPVDETSRSAVLASKASVLFHYGPVVWSVSPLFLLRRDTITSPLRVSCHADLPRQEDRDTRATSKHDSGFSPIFVAAKIGE